AKFDKTFPTLDCAACILTPKMVAVGQHPNIELLTYAEVTDVSGYVGNFKVTIRQKPRYIEVDKCTGCAECEKVCPVEVESEFDEGLTPRKAIHRPFPQAVPSAFTIDKEDALSPCKATCPAQTNAHGYVALVREGKFKEALALIRQRNPFPAICGRVCHHPCEDECNRGKVDEPIAIATLKRFVADYELIEGMLEIPPVPEEKRPEEVAVVGSGPAGLTAAYDLVQMGYPVTIFEAAPRPGGMLTLGIPRYRLPRQLIDTEIRIIEQMGVEIKTNTRLGTDLTLEDLFQQGYRAVFIAVGAQEGKMLDLPGAEAEGVLNGLTFLWQVNLGEEVDLTGKRVVVIGGGNVAMDVARCALRVGARPVDIVCVESREMMPAHKWQVAATEEEILATEEELLAVDRGKHGIHCSLAPTQIVTENGQVKGVEFVPVKRLEFTEDGRLILETFPEPKTRLAADVVIMAVGQGIETEPLQAMGLKLTPRGTIEADPVTLETNRPGVFAGGDVVSGPSSIVEAIAAGHEGATSIDRFLRGVDLREGRVREVKKVTQVRPGVARQARQVMPMRPVEERIRSFAEVELGFTKEMALAEAARCLNCAVCSECLECVKACEPEAINHEMTEEFREIEVGTIILATGYELFDCSQLAQYGYGRLPNVITSLEFERMSSAGGPTGGKIQLQNGEPPSSVAILHCIGSRDENYQEYCSRVCCMYAMKFAHLVREKTQAKVYELYIDLRAFG
ncbi:MAG TPA: hypothetical protein EYP85_04645, partial [Armatimonadetes bacterium]|nr:hypothetical protein [Armatimonadota bacterium]